MVEGIWKGSKSLTEYLVLNNCFDNGSPEARDGLKATESIEMDNLRVRLD
jgi:hypothetical protein